MERKGLTLHSRAPANCPQPEADQSRLCLSISLLKDPFYYYLLI